MKVIIDLMEVYSNYMHLPFLLINSHGEIDYRVDFAHTTPPLNTAHKQLIELKNVSLQIHIPTVMSINNARNEDDHFYILTPQFKIGDCPYFIASGPFSITPNLSPLSGDLLKSSILNFDESQVEQNISKMKNLYDLLVNRVEVKVRPSMPNKIIKILQVLGDLECDIIDYEAYLKHLLQEIMQIESIDFIGLAHKNKDDIFEIQTIFGNDVSQLVNHKFYIGEGLLGKAAILGEDFYWNKNLHSKRNDFFHRYGLDPQNLFGCTLKDNGNVDGIVFGGNFTEEVISESVLNFLKCIVRFVVQRKNISTKISDADNIPALFSNWQDLIDIVKNTNETMHLIYKILDFCLAINNQLCVCFTSVNNEQIVLGKKDEATLKVHQQVIKAAINQKNNVWIEHNYLHFDVNFRNENNGLITLQFDKNTNMQQVLFIITMIETLLLNEHILSKKDDKADEIIFNILHSSMNEINEELYDITQLGIQFAEKLVEVIPITEENQHILLNVCRIMSYDLSYLSKHIENTAEYKLLYAVHHLLENDNIQEHRIEVKILAYIYKVIHKNDQQERVSFINEDLYHIFNSMYEMTLKSTGKDSAIKKVDIHTDQIDEMMDLKGVIETLSLTSREKEILNLILEGLNNQEVGHYLNISVHTVKNHVTNIFKKLNVSDRIQAMTKIYRIKNGDV